MIRKKTIDIPAPASKVTTHEVTISRIARRFKLSIPLATPTPKTPPTSVCVVEIGIRSLEARTIVVAAANSAATTTTWRQFSNLFTYSFNDAPPPHRQPDDDTSTPNPRIQMGTGVLATSASVPPLTMETMAASRSIELATSLVPWAKATKQALII